MAGPAGRLGRGLEAHRCAAPPAEIPGHRSRRREARARGAAHVDAPPSPSDVKTAEALKALNPDLKIGMIGAKVAVEPDATLNASSAIDFVARNEFDFTIKDVARAAISPASLACPGAMPTEPSCTTRTAPSREHGRTALRHAGLQARPRRSRTISSAI
jgi:hypothetical protein